VNVRENPTIAFRPHRCLAAHDEISRVRAESLARCDEITKGGWYFAL